MAVLDKMFSNLDSLTTEQLEELQSRLDAVKSSHRKMWQERWQTTLQMQGKRVWQDLHADHQHYVYTYQINS